MKSLQKELLEALGSKTMEVDELVHIVKALHTDKLDFEIRSGLLPLLSSGEVELRRDGRVSLAVIREPVVA